VRRSIPAALFVLAVAAGSVPAAAGGPIFGKDLVAGRSFPMPWGIGVTYFTQDQPYTVDSLEVGIPGFPAIPTELLKVDNSIDEINAKLDVWLLPYLNVFGIAGNLDGTTDVDLSAVPGLAGVLPFTSLKVKYDGEVYGAGAVLAAGSDRYFASLTGIITRTSLSGDFDSNVEANVLTPRVGFIGRSAVFYVGSMYLDAQEHHSGNIMLPFLGEVPFDVRLSQKEDWNWLAGTSISLTQSFTLELEGGFGDRDHFNAALTYRF